MRAKLPLSRCVQSVDADDAVRQACLCVDRDLEEILAHVNAINVAEVMVEVHGVEPSTQQDAAPWNDAWFPDDVEIPPYILLHVV